MPLKNQTILHQTLEEKIDLASQAFATSYPNCFNMSETRGKDTANGFVNGALWMLRYLKDSDNPLQIINNN